MMMKKYTVLGLVFLICIFQAVAIPTYYMDSNCGRTIDLTTSAQLKLTRFSKYANNLDCTVKMKAPSNKRIMFTFREVDIESGLFGTCNDDYLEIHNGKTTTFGSVPNLHSRLCGEHRPKGAYLATGNYVTLRFRSDWHDRDDGFKIIFTAFHTGKCSSNEFKCDAGQCIASSLKCDSYNQCGDYSDECGAKTVGVIVGVVVAVVVIIAVVAVIVFCVCRRRRAQGYVKRTATPSATTTTTVPPSTTYPAYPQQGYPPQPAPVVMYNAAPMAPPPYEAAGTNPYPYGAPQPGMQPGYPEPK